MKKKLEAELISIAHRILKMKNKSDLAQLHLEAQKLYEKLSVLRFVEDNFSDVKPTIGHADIEEHLSVIFDNEMPQVETSVAPETASDTKKEAIGEIISGIGEKAEKQESPSETTAEIEQKGETDVQEVVSEETQPEPEQPEVQPIAELDAPEEQVASVEIEATKESEEEEEKEDQKPEPAPEPVPEKIQEPAEEEKPKEHVGEIQAKQDDLFKPAFEWGFEAKTEEAAPEAKITPAQISFDDLLGQDYVDPVFVKPEEIDTPITNASADANAPVHKPSNDTSDSRAAELAESNRRLAELRDASQNVVQPRELKPNVIPISRNFADTSNVISINKENLNDRVSKGITIGLNDRIAFMKHLFNNSSEDYNRVLSQLITIDTLDEARSFIDSMVKPDYNNWEGKDEYEQRFMEIIEKKFS